MYLNEFKERKNSAQKINAQVFFILANSWAHLTTSVCWFLLIQQT